SSLSRGGGVWQDPPGAAAAPAAGPAPPARAAAPGRLRPGCPPGGLDHDPSPRARGARGVRGRPGPVAREQAPCPPSAPRGLVSGGRAGPLAALWRCLRWQTPEPQCPQRPTARLRLLPLSGDRRLPLWGRAYLPP